MNPQVLKTRSSSPKLDNESLPTNYVNETETPDAEAKIGTYGFAHRYKNKLNSFEGTWQNLIELPDPDNSDYKIRYIDRWENERKCFDIEHYLADFFFDVDEDGDGAPSFINCISYKPYWHDLKKADETLLSLQEKRILANLPCRTINLTNSEELEVLHSLFDIILAYAFTYRTNQEFLDSHYVCSTRISQLSSTLSWFQVYKNAGEVVTSFFRRGLTFPYFRHWSLNLKALEDAIKIFNIGKILLLNCLVHIYEMFENHPDAKILNELYIEDYLIWIQQVHPDTIKNYFQLTESCRLIKKQDVFPMLTKIEKESFLLLKRGDECRYNEWRNNLKDLMLLMDNQEFNISDTDSSGSDSSSEYESEDEDNQYNNLVSRCTKIDLNS